MKHKFLFLVFVMILILKLASAATYASTSDVYGGFNWDYKNYSTGNINGTSSVGGLAGYSTGNVSNSYATGNVSGTGNGVGGLIGTSRESTVSNSYFTGNVSGTGTYVGGLLGNNYQGTISNSYSTGNVSGYNFVGGLLGYSYGGTISNSFSTGTANGITSVSGFLGYLQIGSVINSYWNNVSGGTPGYCWQNSTGGYNDNCTAIQNNKEYFWNYDNPPMNMTAGNGWNFTTNWSTTYHLTNYPTLKWQSESMSDADADNYTDIDSCAKLQGMWSNLSGWYELTGNVDCAGFDYGDGKGFKPVGNDTVGFYFTGNFTGNGYNISNLNINRISENNVGLFGNIRTGAKISNVSLVNVSIKGYQNIGGLVGANWGSSIFNSYSSGNITGSISVGGLLGWMDSDGTITNSSSIANVTGSNSYTGGLVGLSYGTITNSSSIANVTGSNSYTGGLVGYSDTASTISNSSSSGNVTGTNYVGGMVGRNYGTVSNSYTTGNVSGTSNVGGLIGDNSGTCSNSYYNYNSTFINGANIITIGALYDDKYTLWMSNNKYLNISNYLTKSGSDYIINNVSDFKQLLFFGQNSSLSFRLNSSLNLSSETNFFIPYLSADFNGTGKNITGLNINLSSISMVGLFGYAPSTATITNVSVLNVNINGTNTYYVGGLVGQNNGGTISNSSASGNVSGTSQVGGLVGTSSGIVSNSYSTGNVSGSSSVGGLVGDNLDGGVISNSSFTGTVSGIGYVGGLVGVLRWVVSNSYATGNVFGTSDYVGGLVGYSDTASTVSNSYATGSVSGTGNKVGGLVGYVHQDASVSNSYATGNVSGTNQVGGFLGYSYGGTVSNSFSTGNVSGTSYVSGFIGLLSGGSVINVYWNNISGNLNCSYNSNTNCTAIQNNKEYFYNYNNPPMNMTAGDGWNFTTIWSDYNHLTYYPLFQWQDYKFPVTSFVGPTPANSTGAFLNFLVNVSINETNLKRVVYAFNGTETTYYPGVDEELINLGGGNWLFTFNQTGLEGGQVYTYKVTAVDDSEHSGITDTRYIKGTDYIWIYLNAPSEANTTNLANINGTIINFDGVSYTNLTNNPFIIEINGVLVSSGNFVHDYFNLGTTTNIVAGDNLTLKFETEGEDASYSDDFSTNKYLTDAYNPVIADVGYDSVRDVIFSWNHLGQSVGNLTYKFESPTQFYNSSILFITNKSEAPGANTSVWYGYDNFTYYYLNSTTSNGVSVSASIPSNGYDTFYVQFRTNTNGLSSETPISSIQINYTNHEYFSSGNFVSEPLYFPNITYIGLKWNQTKPSGTDVKIQLRESDDNITWGAWGTNYTNNLGNNITFFFKDYIQYRAWLLTSNQSVTPTLHSVDISFFNASTDGEGKYNYNVTVPTDSLGILPLEVRVEQDFIYQIIWANSTNITVWAATDVPYSVSESFSGSNSNYTYYVNFTRTDLGENDLVVGTINITLSNASGVQATYSCVSTNCTKSWYVPSQLRYGNYTLNLSAHNESNYYRNITRAYYSYLEEKNTTGSLYVENRTISDYIKGSEYMVYTNATITNLGRGSILTPYVFLYDADTGIVENETSEYIPAGRIYPDNQGNATLKILLGNNLNPASYNVIWRVNWTNNDGSIGPNNGSVPYLQYTKMYVIILPNVTLVLSNYSISKRIEHGKNDSFTFQIQAMGSTNLNNITATFIEGNLTNSSYNLSHEWVSVTSPNPIPLIYAGQEGNMSVQISIPYHTSPGNYTGKLFLNSNEGTNNSINLTVEIPLNATWFLIPENNFTYNHSFSLSTPGYVANYTINNTGNANITFGIDYSPKGDPDYTAYGLIIEDRGFEGGIVNPTSITVGKNSTNVFNVYQEGRGQTTLNINIVTLISNSSATPVSRAIEDFWDIEEQPPEITGIWFILNGVAGTIAEQNKNVTIKVKGTDDVGLNSSATRVNISWSGGSTSIPLSGLISDPSQYILDGGSYVVLNYSGEYKPAFTTTYRVNATVYDLVGKSVTSGMYNFTSYGTTSIALSQNISSATLSDVDKYHKGMVYVNYTANNTGFVTGYSPKLNFSTGSSYIQVNNHTFSNISANSTTSYVAQINATELTPPGIYSITANLTWTQPNGNPGTDFKVFTLTVNANGSLSVLPETLSLTTDAGAGNSSIITIENTGNIILNSVNIECISSDCASFDLDYNDSYMSLPLNTSKSVNITFDTEQGIEGKTYLLDFNISNGAVYDLLQSQIQVLETKTWNIEPTSVESIRNTGTSGILKEITVSNIGNVNMTYSLYSANTSLFTINESALSIPFGFSKSFLINYSAPEEAGNYSGIIVITNDDGSASPPQINLTVSLVSTDLSLDVLSPTQEVPFVDLSPGDNITIEANLSYEGQVLTNQTSWNVKFGDTECSSVEYSYNSSGGVWKIICTVPESSGEFFYDLYVEANNELYGIVWVTEENAVSYLDVHPPQFFIIQNNIKLNDNINLQVNITDDLMVNDTTVFASITYPNSTVVEVPLSLVGNYYRNFSLSLNVSGEYIVNYTAEDTTGNLNYSIGWFEVYDNYTWSSVFQDNEGAKLSGINISFYRPSTNTVLISNSTNVYGNISFAVNKRNYDIFVNFSKEQAKIWNKDFSNSTYIIGNVSLGMYTLDAEDFIETIPLYKPFKGIISNSTGFSSDSITAIFNYEGYGYDVSTALGIVKCSSWNLTSNTCASSWTVLSSSRDITTKTVQGNSTGFSAYFLAENKCGNGLCETNYAETTTTCSSDCKESSNGTGTTTTTTSGGGGGGGGGGGLSSTDLSKIEQMIKSFLNVGGVKVETSSIYKELFPGDIATFRVNIVNGLNTKNILEVKASGDVVNLLFFDSTLISLEPNQQSSLLVKVVVPKSLKPGNYDGDLVLMSGGAEGKIPVTIRVLAPEGNLLDVKIQPLSSSVAPGEILRLQTELINLGKTSKVDVQFDIQLMDINTGEILARTEEAFAVENTLRTIKEIKIPETIKTGRYMVKGIAYYSNTEVDGLMQASSLAYIDVNYPVLQRTLFGIKVWMYSLFLLGIAIITGIYYYFQYLEMRKRRFRVKVEVDKLPKAGTDSAFLGKIAETDIRAFMDLDKLKTHVLVAGSTGSGKTVAAQGIIEEALLHNKSVIVFDPTAQWSGFLKGCEDKGMLKRYSYFDMNTKSVRAFNGIIKTIKDPYEKINVLRYMDQPGEITVFNISQLTPQQMEIVVASTIEQIFQSRPEESKELKTLIIYDEVHRLLPKFGGKGEGFIQIERGAREFRKWGIGLVLISQVLSDFVGEIKANIGTEVQLGTRYEGDLERINLKYGEDMLKSVVKSPVGTGMFVNPEYNNGRPYFISFRPLLHSTKRLSDKDLETYGRYFDIVEDLDYQVEQLKKLKVDAIDLELELRLIKKKIKAGQFTMADMYLESLNPMMASQWKKIGRSPQRIQKKRIEKEEIMKGIETAKKEREKYIKSQKFEQIDLRGELVRIYEKIGEAKRKGVDVTKIQGEAKDFQDKAASFGGKVSNADARELIKGLNILKKEVESLK